MITSRAPDCFGAYLDILDRLDEAFPDRELLTRAEVAAWLGVHRNTVTRRFGWPRGMISKVQVARSVSGIAQIQE